MVSKADEADAKNVYKLSLIGSLVLVVISLIALLYVGSQRSRMDEVMVALQSGVDPQADPTAPTIQSIVREGYLRAAALLMVVVMVGALILGIYGAFRVGALGELTLSSYVLLGISAAFVYLVFRMLEALSSITPEKALHVPNTVYASVRSAEILITAALALVSFYAAITYFNWASLRPAATAQGYAPVSEKASSAPAVKGGYVDLNSLRSHLSEARCVAASGSLVAA